MAAATRVILGLLQLAFIICFFSADVNGQSPTITSLPVSLFGASGGVHSVVEDSVIQLYCSVELATAIVSWTKDNVSVIIDVPHLRVRTSSNGTHITSVLTLDNFRSGDNGMYQCHAMSGGVTESGDIVTLTAFSSIASGALVLGQQPTVNERTSVNDGATPDVPLLHDNRTAVSLGETIDPTSTPDADKLLRCVAGHQGDDTTNYSPSTVVWIKDGETVENGGDITISTSMTANGEVSSTLQIVNFQESNAGVYQCIFTDDSSSDGEIITTIPLRLDTGETLTVRRISPETIILRPPEKLVIEVEASGRYEAIFWRRNGNLFVASGAFSVRFPNDFPTSSELVNYFELFVREPTTESDLGVYEVQLDPLDINNQILVPDGAQVDFAVIRAVNANTTAISGTAVTVLEGDSVDISCISTGVPTPSITWSFNDTVTPFNQTYNTVDPKATIVAASSPVTVELGVITSVLHIVSASYPDHDGVYTCVGVNSEDAIFTSSSAFITVQVQVVPEVEVTSDFPNDRINIGGTITLTCSVTRGNPTNYTFEWTGGTLSEKITTNTLTVSVSSTSHLGTYECFVTNDAGTGTGTITIVEGMPPSVTAMPLPSPVVVNNTVELVCVVTGDTPLTINWTLDSGGGGGVTVFTGNDTTGGNFTLTVNSDDYGDYTCSATNVLGSASDTITIIQAVAPMLSPDQSVEVVVGDDLVLTTTFTGFNVPITNLEWTRNGVTVSSATDRITIDQTGTAGPTGSTTLTLSPVIAPSDGGTYIVTVTNDAGSDMTVFTVTVTSPAVITDPGMDFSVSVNETADISLTCTARGVPAPTITWRRDGDILPGTETRITLPPSMESTDSSTGFIDVTSTLTLSNSMRSDTNNYMCEASNTVQGTPRQDQRTFTLTVNFPVTFLESPVDTSALSPAMVELRCIADGEPLPNITWIEILNNETEIELLPSMENITIATMLSGSNVTSTLTIDSTNAIDAARYMCRAVSSVYGAIDSDVAIVNVFVTPVIFAPLEGEVVRGNETENITITCTASGFPEPVIMFERNGSALDGNETMLTFGSSVAERHLLQPPTSQVLNSDGSITVSRSVIIFNLEDRDTDNIICSAMSDSSSVVAIPMIRVTFQLLVQVAPRVTTSPVDVTVTSPETAVFSCRADGVPTPTITWWRYDTTLMEFTEVTDGAIDVTPSGSRTVMSTLTFTNTQPILATQYQCTASNLLGMASETATLTVNDVPLIVMPLENTTVISFDEDTNGTFTCSATAIPPPTITFFRVLANSSRIPLASLADPRLTINMTVQTDDYPLPDGRGVAPLVSRTLMLTRFEDADSGFYSCDAINDVGDATRDVELLVRVAPSFVFEPIDVKETERQPATFMCQVSGVPRPSVTWGFTPNEGAPTPVPLSQMTGEVNISEMEIGDRERSSYLTIVCDLPSDAGNYTCTAENLVAGGSVITSTAVLKVYVSPMVISVYPDEGQMSYTVNEGDTVTFECSATGIPPPTITWLKNGMELNNVADSRVTVGDPMELDFVRGDGETISMVTRTLNLINTTDDDSGMYTCMATNDADPGTDSEEFVLIVQVAPMITSLTPLQLTVTEPNSAIFTCNATARPRPTITWYTDNINDGSGSGSGSGSRAPLVSGTDNVMIMEQETGDRELMSTLTISPTAPSDDTSYVCVAENDVDTDEMTSNLTVYVSPMVTSVYPDEGQMNYTVNEADTVTFECSATGIPPPTITWLRNGMELNNMGDSRVTVGDPMELDFERDDGETVSMVTRTLNLINTTDGDSGMYTCMATNDADPGSNMMNFELIVQVAPMITSLTPLQLTVTEPNSATFICNATARPRPTITWYTDDGSGNRTILMDGANDVMIMEKSTGDRELMSNLTVSSTAPSDDTSYVCVAENDVNTDEMTTDLTVYVSPMVTSVYPDEGQISYTVNEVDPVTFECSATGIPPPTITWLRNGMELNDSRVTVGDPMEIDFTRANDNEIVSMVTRTLNLTDTVDGDSGMYTCMSTNDADPGNSMMDFELIVQIAPMITELEPVELTVTEPNIAEFVCNATARPRPTITWYTDDDMNRAVLVDGVVEQELGERELISTLTISSTAPSDDTSYVCVAENDVDTDEMTAMLTVYVSPMVTSVYPDEGQMNYTVNETDTVTFECSATGIPPPTITWLRNGMELNDSRVTVGDPMEMDFTRANDGETVSMVTRTLNLINTTDDDSGMYTCMATNDAVPGNSMNQMDFELIVQITPTITQLTPLQQNTTSTNMATISCKATGRPRPSITWYRVQLGGTNRTTLSIGDTNIMIQETEMGNRTLTSVLTISQTTPTDATDYVCVAENVVDSDEMTASLTIHVVPEIVFFAPVGGYVVNETFEVTFTCNVTGIPPPVIQWYRNRTLLSGTMDSDFSGTELNSRVVVDEPTIESSLGEVSSVSRSLTVMNAMDGDTGTYRCEATNAAMNGMDMEEFELFVQVPPTIVPMDEDREIIANASEMAVLSFRIERAAPPVPTEDIRWIYSAEFAKDPFIDGVDITNLTNRTSESTLTFSTDLLTLTVNNIAQALVSGDETDRGRYFLHVFHPAGNPFEYIDLDVFGPPLITIRPLDQTVINNGSSAVFACFARAIPQHSVSWTFTNNDGVVSEIISTDAEDTSKYQIVSNSTSERFGELTVMDVQFSDRGTYNCTAINIIDSETRGAILTVHVTPVIERTYTPEDVNLPLSATLVCLVTGYPIPSVSWQKNGSTIDLYGTMVDLQGRIDIFDFEPEGNTTLGSGVDSSGYMGSGSIESLIGLTNISIEEVLSLGELGLVSVLTFDEVVREDTANYTCTAVNELPETTRITDISESLPLVVLERPDAPVNVTAFDPGARWIAPRWIPTFSGNRPVSAFNIYIRNVNKTQNFTFLIELNPRSFMEDDGSGFMYNISDESVVFPFTNYSFRVNACNMIGCSEQSDSSEVIMTDQDRPDAAPVITEAFSPSSTSLYLSWDPPPVELHRGILTGYRITYYIENMDPAVQNTTDTSITLDNLVIFATYQVSVSAGTVVGFGPEDTDMIQTLNDTAEMPEDLTVSGRTETTITLTWSCPDACMSNGDITHFEFSYTGRKTYDDQFKENITVQFEVGELSDSPGANTPGEMTLMNLTPGTVYTITVAAVNGAGLGLTSDSIVGMTEAAPPPPPDPVPVELPTQLAPTNVRTETIVLPTFSEVNAPISHYQVFVVLLPPLVERSSLDPPEQQFPNINIFTDVYQPSLCNGKPTSPQVYVTAEFAADDFPSNKLFIVGQVISTDQSPNDRPNTYTNGELCYSGKYTFFVRAYIDTSINQRSKRQAQRQYDEFQTSGYNPSVEIDAAPVSIIPIIAGIIVAVIVVALIVVIIVIVVVVVMRKRRVYVYKTKDQRENNNVDYIESVKLTEYRPPDEGAVSRQPIPVLALAPHIERMHLNENCGFGEEYRVIQDNSPKHSVEYCMTPENKPRNRYANIQCFDHSRVPLTPVEGAEHDYINANFIEGFNRPKEYIASQGPLPDTMGDFWRLVWDYNSSTIIMLTNLVEKMKVKCSQYWPDSGSQQYSYINVTLVDTITHSDFVIRHFQIKSVNSDVVKTVRQFHFISWPDFGVPRHATPLLHFMRRIRNVHPYSLEQPMIIHCSAGVGRTGTLITIDVELQRAEQEKVVDPFNFVLHMRNERNHMVQTEAQYVFLHDAILEGIASGNTEVAVDKLTQRMAELEKEDADGETGFVKEFDRLRQFKVNIREFTDANDDANKFKNRLANALPFNYNRVHLQMSPGVGGSDYINASFIDGYAKKSGYIATQGPLKNTADDFWRMVWEKEVSVIVMLTQLEEKGKEQCVHYWPETVNSPEKMGSLSIELISENTFEDYICREIKVTDVTSTNSTSRVVKQFHFVAWPENGAPSSGAGMIDLIDQVVRTQQHTGNKPIVVHCSAGIGRTGAFCALSTAIERVKAEGIVDVFHTVKHLRTQRPHMVQSAEQYVFCYKAIREYVESMSNYSNFQ